MVLTGLVLLLAASVDAISRKRSTPPRSKEVGTRMATRGAANQDDVGRRDLARMLRYLHEGGARSRSELVAFTGLNRSTVGVLVSELAEVGLVYEGAGSAGGARRSWCSRSAGSAIVLAFDIRVERAVVAVVGLGGARPPARGGRPARRLHARSRGPQHRDARRPALDTAPPGAAWVGIGIGVPGIVNDMPMGGSGSPPNLGWVDRAAGRPRPKGPARGVLAIPSVSVGNDTISVPSLSSRAGWEPTAAISSTSPARSASAMAVVDGRIMAGAGGYGGEVGHMVVNPAGVLCRCGATGCWEPRWAVMRSCERPGSAASRSR